MCRKWDQKADRCVLTGFDDETKEYRLYNFKTERVQKCHGVTFINEGVINREAVVGMAKNRERQIVRLENVFDHPEPTVNNTSPGDEDPAIDDTTSSEQSFEDFEDNKMKSAPSPHQS